MSCFKYIFLFSIFTSVAQFREDFSDFDLSINPKWEGDTAFFETIIEDGNPVLRSNFSKAKSSASLTVRNSQIISTWAFKIDLGFAPSNSNNISIYLVVDTIDLRYVKNGYYIKIGKSGSGDGLDFYRRVSGKDELIFEDNVNDLGGGGKVSVRVARDERANWLVQNFKTETGKYETLTRFQDNSIQTTRYFGFLMQYTSTRVKGFILDSISLQKAFDFSPPYPIDSKVIGTKILEVQFNEPVAADSLLKVRNYSLNSVEQPTNIRRLATDKIELNFNTDFKIGRNSLKINYLKDTSNNFTTAPTILNFQVADKIPPILNSIQPLEKNQFKVIFSEPIDSSSLAGARNFSLEGQSIEVFQYKIKANILTLFWTENLVIGQTYTLIVQNFRDTAGNSNSAIARKSFIFADQKAPEVISITDISSYSLRLMFSERIDYVQTKSNLNLKLVGLAHKATIQTGDAGTLDIIFDKTLKENEIITLEVENIYDVFGNISSKQSLNFSYDTQKPSLKSFKIVDERTLKFLYSEELKRENAVAHNHYNFVPALKIQNIDYRKDTVIVVLKTPLSPETKYKLTLKNMADGVGNIMNNRTLTLFFDKLPPQLKSAKILFGKIIQLDFSEALQSDSVRLLKNYISRNGSKPAKMEQPTDAKINLYYTTSFSHLDTVFLNLTGLVDLAGNHMTDTLLKLDLRNPKIEHVHTLDSQHLLLWLSEPIEQNLASENFKIRLKSALAFQFLDSTRLKLKFESTFQKTDTLTTTIITDNKGFSSPNLKNNFQVVDRLQGISSKTSQALELNFSHNIDTANLDKTAFILNSTTFPSKLQFFADLPTKILLLFGKPLPKNKPQSLKIGNVKFRDAKIQFSRLETFTIDTLAPQIQKTLVLQNYIVLFLNEPPDLTSAQIINNYILEASTFPLNVSVIDRQIYLHYNFDFQFNKTYRLELKSLRDKFNNAIQNQNITLPSRRQISKHDLAITEVMANPLDNEKLKYEYLELYNHSSDTIELLDLKIADLTTSATLPAHELAPKSYLILTASGSASQHYNNLKIKTLGVPKFPSLNNSAETLTLKDEANNLVEQIHYEDDWYQSSVKRQGGYSLERLNLKSNCHSASNWSGSESPLKGSPAQPNTAAKHDTSAPTVKELKYTNPQTISIYFNERIDTTQTIILNADRLNLKTDHLEVFFNNPLPAGKPYQLTIKELKDCIGNSKTTTIDLLISSPPQTGDLIITEIMVDPTPTVGLPLIEYIELYNRSQSHINLVDYQLIVGSKEFSLGHFILAPQTYSLLTDTEGYEYFKTKTRVLELSNFPSLPNESGFIGLKNSKSRYSFYLNYTDNFYRNTDKQDGGYSLEMLDLNSFCLGEENWQASEAVLGGTPGTVNSSINQIIRAETIQAIDVFAISKSSLYIRTDQNLAIDQMDLKFKISGDFKADTFRVEPRQPKLIEVKLDKSLQENQFYRVEISNLTNCRGQVNSNSQFFTFKLAQKPTYQDLIFNEILFENESPTPEFLEVYNKTQTYLDLQNLKLARVNEENKRTTKILLTEPFVLKPESYLVFTKDEKSLSKLYEVDEKQIVRTDLSNLNNTKDRLVLLGSSDNPLDSLPYDKDWHLSFLQETRNVALERIDFEAPTYDENNWQSAAQSVNFATPTRPNSQAKSVIGLAGSCFETNPVFTPNFDGVDDFMILRYNCQVQNNSLTIHIYNLAGVLIKTLVENYSIGNSGFLKWDGTDKNGQVVPLGHYILDIVVFNPQGNRTKMRKKVVVGSKF